MPRNCACDMPMRILSRYVTTAGSALVVAAPCSKLDPFAAAQVRLQHGNSYNPKGHENLQA